VTVWRPRCDDGTCRAEAPTVQARQIALQVPTLLDDLDQLAALHQVDEQLTEARQTR
jgi:hypothetical protein